MLAGSDLSADLSIVGTAVSIIGSATVLLARELAADETRVASGSDSGRFPTARGASSKFVFNFAGRISFLTSWATSAGLLCSATRMETGETKFDADAERFASIDPAFGEEFADHAFLVKGAAAPGFVFVPELSAAAAGL
jgi:hypothetical protein